MALRAETKKEAHGGTLRSVIDGRGKTPLTNRKAEHETNRFRDGTSRKAPSPEGKRGKAGESVSGLKRLPGRALDEFTSQGKNNSEEGLEKGGSSPREVLAQEIKASPISPEKKRGVFRGKTGARR